jgi:hypothetical protein
MAFGASWLLGEEPGSNAHAASGFRLRLDTTNQDAVLQWAQFHRWSPRTRIYEGVGTIGRSADSRASRAVAWDSSLSANASKVLSTRALLPIAPRRHSAASTLRNSGEFDSQKFWRVHSIHRAIATPRLEADA